MESWTYTDPILQEREEDLLYSWLRIFRDLPTVFGMVIVTEVEQKLWDHYCDQISSTVYDHFEDFYYNVQEHYNAIMDSTTLPTVRDCIIVKLYHCLQNDFRNWNKFALENSEARRTLDQANRTLGSQFRKSKARCPLNLSLTDRLLLGQKRMQRDLDRMLTDVSTLVDQVEATLQPPQKRHHSL